MRSTLTLSTLIPLLEMMWPRTIPCFTIKWHFSQFKTKFFSIHLCKTSVRWCKHWSNESPKIEKILSYFFITHILSFTFHITTYVFLTSYHFYLFFYISLIPSSHSTPLLMVDSFEECTWFDGKFTNFVRIWAYEQPLCSNYFCYVNINPSLFILELALLCMLKPHYEILCIKMIRANHFPFFYSRIFFSLPEDLYLLSLFEP